MKIDLQKVKGMSDAELQKYVYGLANREAGKKQVRKDREEKLKILFDVVLFSIILSPCVL